MYFKKKKSVVSSRAPLRVKTPDAAQLPILRHGVSALCECTCANSPTVPAAPMHLCNLRGTSVSPPHTHHKGTCATPFHTAKRARAEAAVHPPWGRAAVPLPSQGVSQQLPPPLLRILRPRAHLPIVTASLYLPPNVTRLSKTGSKQCAAGQSPSSAGAAALPRRPSRPVPAHPRCWGWPGGSGARRTAAAGTSSQEPAPQRGRPSRHRPAAPFCRPSAHKATVLPKPR